MLTPIPFSVYFPLWVELGQNESKSFAGTFGYTPPKYNTTLWRQSDGITAPVMNGLITFAESGLMAYLVCFLNSFAYIIVSIARFGFVGCC